VFDGWALSTSAAALLEVWNLAPHARCAAWLKTWATNGWSRVRWSWEPVLFVTDRKGLKPGERSSVWDGLVCAPNCGVGSWSEIPGKGGGAKPHPFVRWVLELLDVLWKHLRCQPAITRRRASGRPLPGSPVASGPRWHTDTVSSAAYHTVEHRRARVAWAAQLTGPTPTICPFCLRPIRPWEPWDLDHKTPVAHGGANGPLRPAHARCNRTNGGGIRTRHTAAPSRDW
jgi:hypothetical protein